MKKKDWKKIGAKAVPYLLILPVVLSSTPIEANPDYVIGVSMSSFAFFLFALATAMNSISSEFESGTIVPLLTKPVYRTMVFLGKLFATFMIILMAYTILYVYTVVGGILICLYLPMFNIANLIQNG